MKLVKEYRYTDHAGKPVPNAVAHGHRDVIDEYVVLSRGERKVLSYTIVVVASLCLLSEFAVVLSVVTNWSLTGSNSILNPVVWTWKLIWVGLIGLLAMPLTGAAAFALLRQTWFVQAERIEEERKKSTALVKRQTDEVELRHNARRALVAAAESGVYDKLGRDQIPDVKDIMVLEKAARETWE